jgi:intein/homing endonuclease
MKGLLRSVIDYGGINQDNLIANFQKLTQSHIEWPHPADKRIFQFLRGYFHQRLELPSKQTIVDHFEHQRDQECIERVSDHEAVSPYSRTNFTHLLHETLEEQNRVRAITILKESQEIITKGLIVDEERKQGLRDGVLHFARNTHRLLVYEHNSRIDGNIRDDGQEVWDEYLDAKSNKGNVWGMFCGINGIDSVIKGVKKGEMWVHAAFVGELKCLSGDVTVFDHKTQRRRCLKEMFDCGSLPTVTAIADEGKSNSLILAEASHLVQNGEREVFDLTLESGRTLGATSNHKFLTSFGWRDLSELSPGDLVATPRIMHAIGSSTYSADEVKVVGYLIGGGRVNDCINFTQENEVIRDDFTSCLEHLGFIQGEADYESPNFSVVFPREGTPFVRVAHGLGDRWHRVTSPLRVLLERLALYGKDSYSKRIPSEFFGLTEDLIAVLLGALWSTDGFCSTGKQSSHVIAYHSVSHGLCLDVQSLLLRLGVQSTVSKVRIHEDGFSYQFWVTRVITNSSKALFCSRVIVIGKESRFQHLASRILNKDNTYSDSVLYGVVKTFDADSGDIYWDRVASVVCRGIEMTYDLSVPGPHTFVANDIITHNTTFALNWAYNLVTRYRKSVLYVTLEMPYEQVRSNIYVMHSSNGKWKSQGYQPLDYDKIKSGELTSEEEKFYQLVIKDLNENEKYGRFDVWGPDEDITIDEVQQYAELKHQEEELNLLVIDHGGLLEPRKRKRNKDYTVELNSVLRDTKKLALHFNHGEKIPILVLFQINRDGKDFADKNEGRYKLRALSYANECLEEGTLIRTDLGFIPIESVPVGCQVWSSSGWKTVLNNFSNGVRDLVSVETFNGLVLRVTADHLFRTLSPSGLSWSKAKDLSGKHILLDISGGLNPMNPLVLPELVIEKYENPNYAQSTILRAPEVMTIDLAYLIGSHDGSGKNLDPYRVGWTGNRLGAKVRSSIQSRFLACFGHSLSVIYSLSRPESFDLMQWSKPLHRWFNLVGMDHSSSVSGYILRSGSDIQGSYLKGVWDTEGSINKQGNLSLGMSSKKVNLIRQIHLIMLGLGIQCYITQDTQEHKGKIRVSGRSAKQRFLEVTGGFTDTHKQQRLQKSILLERKKTKLWPVSSIYLKLYTKYRSCGLTKMSKRCVRAAKRLASGYPLVQQRAIEDLLSNLVHVQGDPKLDLLRRLLETTTPVQVKSVTSCGSGPVYDLEVTGDHEYSTGGVLTHNCERSADVVTTTYLNEEHRKEGTVLFDCLKRRDGMPFLPFKAGIKWGTKRINNFDTFHGVDEKGISVDDLNLVLGVDSMFQV